MVGLLYLNKYKNNRTMHMYDKVTLPLKRRGTQSKRYISDVFFCVDPTNQAFWQLIAPRIRAYICEYVTGIA